MILEKIQEDLKEAMKAGDQGRVSALRYLLAQIHNQQIALRQVPQGKPLTDEEVVGVLQKQVKERRESIEAFRQGGREDLLRREEAELAILNKYLPQQLSTEELEKVTTETIKETGATGPADFGKVMKTVMERVKGQAEGSLVAKLVKEKLA